MSDFSSGVSTIPSLMWSFLLHWAMLVSLHKYVYVVLAGFNYWLLYLMLVRWWWNYLLNTMFYLISITSTLTLDENLVEHLISQRILTVVPTIASPKELLGDFFFFFWFILIFFCGTSTQGWIVLCWQLYHFAVFEFLLSAQLRKSQWGFCLFLKML